MNYYYITTNSHRYVSQHIQRIPTVYKEKYVCLCMCMRVYAIEDVRVYACLCVCIPSKMCVFMHVYVNKEKFMIFF